MKIASVLCPTDFSPQSRAAFEEACAQARQAKAKLILAHVHHLFIMAMPEMAVIPVEMVQRGVAALDAQLARLREEALANGLTDVQTVLLEGPAWDRIVSLARHEAVDLIVMGTHGRTAIAHALLGSVAEKVIRHAPCSVLVVRPQP